jgi:hypothetical protein
LVVGFVGPVRLITYTAVFTASAHNLVGKSFICIIDRALFRFRDSVEDTHECVTLRSPCVCTLFFAHIRIRGGLFVWTVLRNMSRLMTLKTFSSGFLRLVLFHVDFLLSTFYDKSTEISARLRWKPHFNQA